jgi:hypothetical protein
MKDRSQEMRKRVKIDRMSDPSKDRQYLAMKRSNCWFILSGFTLLPARNGEAGAGIGICKLSQDRQG